MVCCCSCATSSSDTAVKILETTTLLAAGQGLVDMIAAFDKAGCNMSRAEMQACWDALHQHLALTAHMEEIHTPKRHLLMHMLRMMPWAGNPRFYACWRDEALNRMLKASCRTVPQATFDITVLTNMANLLEHENKKKRKRQQGGNVAEG